MVVRAWQVGVVPSAGACAIPLPSGAGSSVEGEAGPEGDGARVGAGALSPACRAPDPTQGGGGAGRKSGAGFSHHSDPEQREKRVKY